MAPPIPVVCTLIGWPSNVPVKPSMPRTSLTCRNPESKNVSAMYSGPNRVAGTEDMGCVIAEFGAKGNRHDATLGIARKNRLQFRVRQHHCCETGNDYFKNFGRRIVGQDLALGLAAWAVVHRVAGVLDSPDRVGSVLV